MGSKLHVIGVRDVLAPRYIQNGTLCKVHREHEFEHEFTPEDSQLFVYPQSQGVLRLNVNCPIYDRNQLKCLHRSNLFTF